MASKEHGSGTITEMRRVAIALLVVTGVAAPSGMSGDDPAPRAAFAAVELHPLNRQARVQCQLATQLAICPARLPRATIALGRPSPPPVYAERYRPGRNGDAVMVGMSFSYGAPWEPGSGSGWRHHLWRNRPCCFLHLEIWRSLRGVPPFPDGAHRARLAGRVGDLAPATGYGLACGAGNAGVWFCNHTRFRWRESGVWYVASIHRFGKGGEDTRLLGRLIAELRHR